MSETQEPAPDQPEYAEPTEPSEPDVAPPEETPAPDLTPPQNLPSEHVMELNLPEEHGPGNDPSHSAQEGDESGLEMDELLDQIIAGKWGNGQEQRYRLAVAGYDHNEVREALAVRMNPPSNT